MTVTALLRLMVNVLLLLTAQDLICCVQTADAAFVRIDPNRLQFFEYESISFDCAGFHGPSEWRVIKNNPTNSTQWETSAPSLNINPAFVSHSGEYWCENGEGERSNTVNITVTDGDVILESPAVPVMEQQTVTLRCRKKTTSSNPPADFYKEDHFIKTGYKGKIVFDNISKFNEGLYKCSISGPRGQSPESWMAVRALISPAPQERTTQEGEETLPQPPHLGSVQLSILLPTVFSILCVAALLLVVRLLHFRKQRVACFSSEVPTTQSDPVVPAFDHVTEADPDIATYANVVRHKKKRAYKHAAEDDPQMTTYVNVTRHKKKRGCRNANSANHQETYAVVSTKRKERVSGDANVAGTTKKSRRRREVMESRNAS